MNSQSWESAGRIWPLTASPAYPLGGLLPSPSLHQSHLTGPYTLAQLCHIVSHFWIFIPWHSAWNAHCFLVSLASISRFSRTWPHNLSHRSPFLVPCPMPGPPPCLCDLYIFLQWSLQNFVALLTVCISTNDAPPLDREHLEGKARTCSSALLVQGHMDDLSTCWMNKWVDETMSLDLLCIALPSSTWLTQPFPAPHLWLDYALSCCCGAQYKDCSHISFTFKTCTPFVIRSITPTLLWALGTASQNLQLCDPEEEGSTDGWLGKCCGMEGAWLWASPQPMAYIYDSQSRWRLQSRWSLARHLRKGACMERCSMRLEYPSSGLHILRELSRFKEVKVVDSAYLGVNSDSWGWEISQGPGPEGSWKLFPGVLVLSSKW